MTRKTQVIALAMSLLGAAFAAHVVFAQEDGGDGAQVGAKGLFFEQLDKPKESINTGLRYWIELDRKGASGKVSGKEPFFAGDRIRFHVRPNIDGYAYILLSSGSRGEHSVLFPQPGESNKVEHGHDYELPADGYLTFDNHPGTEKLTLLLSRNTIDAEAFLAKPPEAPAMIAALPIGTKGLAVNDDSTSDGLNVGTKDLVPAQHVYIDEGSSTSGSSTTISLHNQAQQNLKSKKQTAHEQPTTDQAAITTVVRKTPSGVLFVNVNLHHK